LYVRISIDDIGQEVSGGGQLPGYRRIV